MDLIKEILQTGMMNKNYPHLVPSIVITPEEQDLLLKGEMLIFKDNKYNAKWLVRMSEKSRQMKSTLSKEDIILDPLEKMESNPVRAAELHNFYSRTQNYQQ